MNDDEDVLYYTEFPRKIEYFSDNGIKIRDIQSGTNHILAIDYEDKIYSWGQNDDGQCGDGTTNDIYEPKSIKSLNEYKIDIARCGEDHSYVKTKCGKHFMFGSNEENECMTFTDEKKITIPRRVDDVIYNKCGIKTIIEVIPGHFNTKIIAA